MTEAYQQFEKEFGEWAKVQNVVCCSSGTAALHLALEAMQLPPGSKVVCPDFTMVACPRAIVLAGLVPVFVDCTPDLRMDLDLLDEAASAYDVKAIMAVHIYGRRNCMSSIHALAADHGLKVVEDMAEVHDVPVDPSTDAACWSFYRNKIIAGEEGGAVAFKDRGHAVHASQLRSLGFTVDHDFMHIPRGHNYRLSNSHARLILASLRGYRHLSPFLGGPHYGSTMEEARRRIEGWYNEQCPIGWRMPPRDAPWVYDLRIPGLTSERQGEVIRELNRAGIAARHGFKPMSRQEEFKGCRKYGGEAAVRASREVLYLPIQPGVTSQDTARLAFQILKARIPV